jgi:hypothetical protein
VGKMSEVALSCQSSAKTRPEARKEGKYIYCITESNQSRTFGSLGMGNRGDELYAVCFNDLAAIVSNSLIINYSISRENLLVHEKAIEEIMREHTVLPVRFGTIAQDDEQVKKILEKKYEEFKDLLNMLKDKKELGLKAIFKEGIYKDILEKYANIKALKEKLEELPLAKTYYQRMEIGKMVESALQKEKEIYKEDILSTLSPLAVEVKINSNYGETMIINAAFLVENNKEAEFDQRIQELDKEYADLIKFKYIGTLPPFNFVNLVIKTEEY